MNTTESKPSFAAFLAANAGAIVRATTEDIRSSFDTDFYGSSHVVEIWDGAKVETVSVCTTGYSNFSGVDPVRWSETPDEVYALWQSIKPDLSEANAKVAGEIYRASVLAAAATVTETTLARQINERLDVVIGSKHGWKFKGLNAVVVKGRKVAKGTSGRFFWHGESQYGFRAGLEVNGETVWISADNLSLDLNVEINGVNLRDLAIASGLGAARSHALDLIAKGGLGPIGNTVHNGRQGRYVTTPEQDIAAIAYEAAEATITNAAYDLSASAKAAFKARTSASQSAPRD